jgi:hypothetical protein
VAASEPRPAAWLAYEPIVTPVRTGPVEDVFDVAHGLLAVVARRAIAAGHEYVGSAEINETPLIFCRYMYTLTMYKHRVVLSLCRVQGATSHVPCACKPTFTKIVVPSSTTNPLACLAIDPTMRKPAAVRPCREAARNVFARADRSDQHSQAMSTPAKAWIT